MRSKSRKAALALLIALSCVVVISAAAEETNIDTASASAEAGDCEHVCALPARASRTIDPSYPPYPEPTRLEIAYSVPAIQ